MTWRLVLGALPADARADPNSFLERLASGTGVRGIEVGERGGSTLLLFGRYGSPEASDAKRDMARLRAVEVNGARPFAGAFFLPPDIEAARGRNAAYDLRNARARFGSEAIYSLHVGVYARGDGRPASPEDLLAFQEAAEEAVEQLRAEGQPAFYYHGPTSSSVTVGVFGTPDHDATVNPPLESRRLREAREAFPHALLNGRGVKQRARDSRGRVVEQLQGSYLVTLPR
ncbi:MAG: hypothetical protein AAGI53_13665 [Planctomycetota bacterium]